MIEYRKTKRKFFYLLYRGNKLVGEIIKSDNFWYGDIDNKTLINVNHGYSGSSRFKTLTDIKSAIEGENTV